MALRDQPYISLYVQDFMTDEKLCNCSAETTGVYIRLMCILHKSEIYGTYTLKDWERPRKDGIDNLAQKLARQMPYSAKTIKRGLSELLRENVVEFDGITLRQKRMVRDGEISAKRSAAINKRWSGEDKTDFVYTNLDTKCDTKCDTKGDTKGDTKTIQNTENENETENEYENENTNDLKEKKKNEKIMFDEFYAAYPHKVGKPKAEKAFAALHVDAPLYAKIMQGLQIAKQSDQWSRDNGRYIPNPATWLNQQRWNDEYHIRGQTQSINTACTSNNGNDSEERFFSNLESHAQLEILSR